MIEANEQMKHLSNVPTMKYVDVSSIAKSTAPMGAPNVTTVPAQMAAESI